MAKKARTDARRLAEIARQLRREIATALRKGAPELVEARRDCSCALQQELDDDTFADDYAQAAVCTAMVATACRDGLKSSAAVGWLRKLTSPLHWQLLLDEREGELHFPLLERLGSSGIDETLEWATPQGHVCDRYEAFLREYDPSRRSRRGVYYTPSAIARYIVAKVDRTLRCEFALSDGLADTATWRDLGRSPPPAVAPDAAFVQILDPAIGAGVFLEATIAHIHQTMRRRWRCSKEQQGRDRGNTNGSAKEQDAWSRYVIRHLLPRLHGFEILPAACAVAQLRLVHQLAETGFQFADAPTMLDIQLRDTLRPHTRAPAASVIVGNPPFSGVSTNRGDWIERLLKDSDAANSYFRINGEPLGERKTWLGDDYVKFFRVGQWIIESTGCGVLAFVSNHGYLDNITFRAMRNRLLAGFDSIDVLDLHGNRKGEERAPAGRRDENVFQVEQGVAISVFGRTGSPSSCRVAHGELWGDRQRKLDALTDAAQSLDQQDQDVFDYKSLTPTAPEFLFTSNDHLHVHIEEFARGWPLPEVMPVNTTAPVTARDSLIVDVDRSELLSRIELFRRADISDDELRAKFFPGRRASKYAPGDTRGWKLNEARATLRNDEHWRERVCSCLYRPFDQRFVYWTNAMVDWPRRSVSAHLLRNDNLALIARRQTPPGAPRSFFWVTDRIALDGVVRSDNRGSESVFPVHLGRSASESKPNFSPQFLTELERHTGLRLSSSRRSTDTYSAEELSAVIYAQLFSAEYRKRFSAPLGREFPRVFVPRSRRLFHSLSQLGLTLFDLHIPNRRSSIGSAAPQCQAAERSSHPAIKGFDAEPKPARLCFTQTSQAVQVEGRFPLWCDGRIEIDESTSVSEVDAAVWEFQVGAHQVLRKWLRDRRGRRLAALELSHYVGMVRAIEGTVSTMAEIDSRIRQSGGWPAAFAPREEIAAPAGR